MFHRTLLFSFFLFFSFHSLKHWRTFNIHVNIPCKFLSPPVFVDSTRFSLYAITEVSRKPKHTHFNSWFQNIHFLCAIFSRSQMRGEWWCQFGCLGGVYEIERTKSSTLGAFTSDEQIFIVQRLSVVSSLMLESLEGGEGEEVWLPPVVVTR